MLNLLKIKAIILEGIYKNSEDLKNRMMNWKYILRRNLGKVKRTLKHRHLVIGNHYKRLSYSFKKHKDISKREIWDNLVLNGYPIEDK